MGIWSTHGSLSVVKAVYFLQGSINCENKCFFSQVFVTGGIGGVHRGAEVSMDISADLTELGR